MNAIRLCLVLAFAVSGWANSVPPLAHKDAVDLFASRGGVVETLDDGTLAVRAMATPRKHWQIGWQGSVRDLDVIVYIQNVSVLEVDGIEIDDARLINIAQHRKLRELHVNSTELSDVSMQLVAQMCTGLRKLSLRNAKIRGDHFGVLIRLPGLRELDVSGAPLIAERLRVLWRMKNLLRLNLSDTGLDDTAIPDLLPLKQLQALNLAGTKVTDAGISLLRDLPALTHLELARTGVACRIPLGRLPLSYLGLADSAIDDDSLPVIGTLWNLKHLDLNRTKITDQGLREISTMALYSLLLEGVTLSSAGIVYLSDMSQLERLRLDGVKGYQLPALQRLKKVQDLTLLNTDVELVRLRDLPALRRLQISGSVQALELAQMPGMNELELADCKLHTIDLSVLPNLRIARLPGHHYNLPAPEAKARTKDPLPDIASIRMRKVGVSALRLAARIHHLDLMEMPRLHHLDIGLATVRKLTLAVDHLTHLRVGGRSIASLPKDFFYAQSSLTNVYLWGTSITDAHLAEVAKSESLRGVHLRQASVSKHGIRYLRWIPTLSRVCADEYYVSLNGMPDFEEGEFAAPVLIQDAEQVATSWASTWTHN